VNGTGRETAWGGVPAVEEYNAVLRQS